MTELSDDDLHRKAARASFATRAFVLFVGIALALILVGTAVGVALIRNQQVSNAGTLTAATAAAKNSQQTGDAIRSCVTPGQPCYERAQRQQGNVVGQLNQYVVLSAACTARITLNGLPPNVTQDELTQTITACVVRQLAQSEHR